MILDIGRADQREFVLVRDREDDAPVGVLEDIGEAMREEPRHDDVAALDQPYRCAPCASGEASSQEARRPTGPVALTTARARRRRARRRGRAAWRARRSVGALDALAARARQHPGAVLGGIERVQHHEARVVDPAVRIDEAAGEALLQRAPCRMRVRRSIAARRGQAAALGEVVVEEQTRADHPRRAAGAHHAA